MKLEASVKQNPPSGCTYYFESLHVALAAKFGRKVRLASGTANTQSLQDKLATRAIAVLIAYAALAGVVHAAIKPFWYDELYTLALTRQPNVSTIWDALRHAVDTFPPTFYLLERATGLIPGERLALRLPSLVAFCCLVLCIFVFVRRRSGSTCALICAAVLLLSKLYDPYAVEARGYSLSTACLALALVCYQRADSRWWIALLALSLTAAEALHYYAVFAFLPLALAEIAFFWETRRLRWGVWTALLVGTMPLLLFWPLLMSVKHLYGHDFWAQASLLAVADVYGWFFQLPVSVGVALALVPLIWLLRSQRFREAGSEYTRSVDAPFHEIVLVLGLLALPCVLFLVAKFTHSGLTERYAIPALLAFPLAAGYILPRLDQKILVLVGAFVCSTLIAQEALFWVPLRHYKAVSPAAAIEKQVSGVHPELPVVVSDAISFLKIAHYASPQSAKRFVCLVDPPKARIYAHTGNVDTDLLVLRSYIPLQVYDIKEFTPTNPDFLLYSSGDPRWDWWPERLLDDGYTLKVLSFGADRSHKVYLAKAAVAVRKEMLSAPTGQREALGPKQPVSMLSAVVRP